MVEQSKAREHRESDARRRFVLLGASNLTRGFSTAVEIARTTGDGPVEVFAAMGHGRSYGVGTSVLGRYLPGILDCGIWRALQDSKRQDSKRQDSKRQDSKRQDLKLQDSTTCPTAALVTDIGNDLCYGFSVEQIAAWVDECFGRLEKNQAQVVVTQLPTENFFSIPNWRYLLLRSIFFPRCRLSLQEIRQRAEALNESVCRSARARGFDVIRPRSEWFGLDPIHIRRRFFRRAWSVMMQSFSDGKPIAAVGPPHRCFALRGLKPEQYRRFGVSRGVRQPSCRLSDTSAIAIY